MTATTMLSEREQNEAAYRALLDDLFEGRRQAWQGGPPATHERHLQRGRILVRDRIALLLDPGSPFLEIGELAGEGMYEGVAPGAGLVTGVGLILGRACMVIANLIVDALYVILDPRLRSGQKGAKA